MGGFAMAQAQLAALFMQSVAYGVHMVTFGACMYSWFRRPSDSRSSMRWMVVAVAFFVIGTCDVSFNFYHNILAFIEYKGRGGANEEFQDASSWVNVMRVSETYTSHDTDTNSCYVLFRACGSTSTLHFPMLS